ncbi:MULTISPECIES: TRAP transporter large permease [unclassified Bosea (in: a-proteobacteria)]|uniref:TRAP transporter large permease n=1 Tax=unclassified Bosea (in: a-proteobacteria) TaxID=2653178 RepID=UPI000F74DB96|nr:MULTISPECIES: TRAP transporter large permease [unclassified Bosea (in: a-proteobacteria)]AZO80107.1 ABC transporter permease [Bosea sp. Tri-49]RXT22894.1 ABC transporter permease [Bosea sp. Tri-39]RXT38363.1 ABC transporter permease [Bosea sp. Tri-54]
MTTLMFQIGGVWFLAMLAGVPLFASMGLAAFAFVFFGDLTLSIVPQKIAQAANSFPLLAAPLFILMGNILNSAGITEKIFAFATAVVGWMRGGLCHANIIASVIFSGMSGSAVADAAGVGTIEIKAMIDEGYDRPTAAAITAASATIGPIIPPSLPMVIYGVSADVSIGALFLAGVIPGLLMAAALMAMVWYIATKRNLPRHPWPGFSGVWKAFLDAFWALMAPVILFGGMMSGYFTPTEAAAVAAVYALILGLFVYRDFDLRDLPKIIVDTVETTGVVMCLVMVAGALGWCMSISRVPQTLTPAIVENITNPLVFLLVCNIILLVVGCFMEALAAMLILIPILVPAALSYGIDPVHFGLMFIFNLILGTIHPPVGVVIFVTAKIANISFEAMSKAIMPWLVPLLATLVAITLWPPLSTWLPNLVLGK